MTTIRFEIPGVPVAKGRPKVSTINGRPMMRTPERTVAYESRVALAARDAMGGRAPVDSAVIVVMVVVMPIPRSWPKRQQAAALAGEIRPIGKPDLDNLQKALGDGGNGIVWTDDSRIVEWRVSKRYGERPHVSIVATWSGGEAALSEAA